MNKKEIINQLRELQVKESKTVSIDTLAQKWADRSESLVKAAFKSLKTLRGDLPMVELRTRCNGVSGYGPDRTTKKRKECFHIGVNVRPVALVFYQHGEAHDPNNLFPEKMPKNDRIRRGYLREEELPRLSLFVEVLCDSYRRITGSYDSPKNFVGPKRLAF